MNQNTNLERHGRSLDGLLDFSYKLPFGSKNYFSKDDIIAPWIIDKIKKREEERKRNEDQPRVYIDIPPYQELEEKEEEEKPKRGVTIIDLIGDDE